MFHNTKPHVDKMRYIDTELAGHVHKLDVKLQRLCGSGFSLLCAFLPSLVWRQGDGATCK